MNKILAGGIMKILIQGHFRIFGGACFGYLSEIEIGSKYQANAWFWYNYGHGWNVLKVTLFIEQMFNFFICSWLYLKCMYLE